MVSNKYLVKRKFPYIDTFNHEGPKVISVMRNLTTGVFEHLEITSHMDVDQRVAYTKRILRGDTLKNYIDVLVPCRHSDKELAGDEWNLEIMKGISTEEKSK